MAVVGQPAIERLSNCLFECLELSNDSSFAAPQYQERSIAVHGVCAESGKCDGKPLVIVTKWSKALDDSNANDYHYLKGGAMKTLFIMFSLFSLTAYATDNEATLIIRDHRFEPEEVRVPAGQKIKLVVHNQDGTPEEFESYELNREKIAAPGAKVTIYIGPLSPGRYPFFGEFHEKTARGAIVAE